MQQDHGPDKRIYMLDADPRVPNAVAYPLEGVLSLVDRNYLRSSPAMALALAIYLGYTDIALYGSELSSNTEYHYQAINYAYWIGYADGRPDINLDLECWHQEFNQPIYGFEGELQIGSEYFSKHFQVHEKVWKDKKNTTAKLDNKIDNAILDAKFEKAGELSLVLENANTSTGEAFGKMQEAERYAERTNQISRQEFERVAAQAQLDGEMHEKNMNHSAGKCEYVWNVWKQTGHLEAKNQFRTFLKEKNEHAFEMGLALGVFRENMEYQKEYDALVTAAGGKRAVYFEGRETEVKRVKDVLSYVIDKWDLHHTPKSWMPIMIPNTTRRDLGLLFAELGYRSGAEIGVNKGSNALRLNRANPECELFCIDPWEMYDGMNDFPSQKDRDGAYLLAKQRLDPIKNVQIIRKYSMDAVEDFEDETLDFVFIDGNHEWPYVTQDIFYWRRKLSPVG